MPFKPESTIREYASAPYNWIDLILKWWMTPPPKTNKTTSAASVDIHSNKRLKTWRESFAKVVNRQHIFYKKKL